MSEAEDRRHYLSIVAQGVKSCTACSLHAQRTHTVFARGSETAELMFVGEAPGADENASGEPFVGAAGLLLDKMIAAMGFEREEVYVCNVVKCRPPENRKPTPEEMGACEQYLREQIETVKPKVIVALGSTATEALLGTKSEGIGRLRGKVQRSKWGVDFMPTYHPAYLLGHRATKEEMTARKKLVWEDLQIVCGMLGREPAGAKGGAS